MSTLLLLLCKSIFVSPCGVIKYVNVHIVFVIHTYSLFKCFPTITFMCIGTLKYNMCIMFRGIFVFKYVVFLKLLKKTIRCFGCFHTCTITFMCVGTLNHTGTSYVCICYVSG